LRRAAWIVVLALLGCTSASSLEEARIASPSPEIASCAEWFRALDAEVASAGVRDLQYAVIPGFPYLRADRFLAGSAGRAAAQASAFEALGDRLLSHDLESRRYEIDNLPAAVVEKWSGMRFDDARALALRRSVQCGRLLRGTELARPEMRSTLLARLVLPPSPAPGPACEPPATLGEGAKVRFSPPPARLSRAAVAGWLLRAELDPLGQALIPEREFEALAATYAPGLQISVASDADRFGALRWRRGAARPEVDATEPVVYVRPAYARYGERVLLQIVYVVLFPNDRIALRATLAPDGEPLAYDASGADGCYSVALTPRARLRDGSVATKRELPQPSDDSRPLLTVAPATHRIDFSGVVSGTESLVRYALRPYDELRSTPTLDGRNRAAIGRPALDDGDRIEQRFAFDLPEPQP
jgi:hypothetical protein